MPPWPLPWGDAVITVVVSRQRLLWRAEEVEGAITEKKVTQHTKQAKAAAVPPAEAQKRFSLRNSESYRNNYDWLSSAEEVLEPICFSHHQ